MVSKITTMFAMCMDRRLVPRELKLIESIKNEEGQFPFRIVRAGGCLLHQTDSDREEVLYAMMHGGVTQLYLEDHMGANPLVPGCVAFFEQNKLKNGDQARYPWQVEKLEHINRLQEIGWQYVLFAKRHGLQLTVSAGLYLHDETGHGKQLPVKIVAPSRYETAFR